MSRRLEFSFHISSVILELSLVYFASEIELLVRLKTMTSLLMDSDSLSENPPYFVSNNEIIFFIIIFMDVSNMSCF